MLQFNEFAQQKEFSRIPEWRATGTTDYKNIDTDNILLKLEDFGGFKDEKVLQAINIVVERNSYHPVKDYLNSLEWDKKPRLEELFIHHFNAPDTPYVRAATRKHLIAAVARIFEPGCKYDQILTLVGQQGWGKSTILAKLGMEWFSDSLGTVVNADAKAHLIGNWILELQELVSLKYADSEAFKAFASTSKDKMRQAYRRDKETHLRQNVFFATTNESAFLKDQTGNRRFWIIDFKGEEKPPSHRHPAEVKQGRIDQIWAEAKTYYDQGESLRVPPELDEVVEAVEDIHRHVDEWEYDVREYVDTKIPSDWYSMSVANRVTFFQNPEIGEIENGMLRQHVSPREFLMEKLGKKSKEISPRDSHRAADAIKKLTDFSSTCRRKRVNGHNTQRSYFRFTPKI